MNFMQQRQLEPPKGATGLDDSEVELGLEKERERDAVSGEVLRTEESPQSVLLGGPPVLSQSF